MDRSPALPPRLSIDQDPAPLGLGHLRAFKRDPWAVMARFNRECGDIGRLTFFGNDLVIANAPELVAELLVTNASHYRKSPILRAALFPLVGEGLFTSEGNLWRAQRKLMAPLFHPARVAELAPMMVERAATAIASLKNGEVIDVGRFTTRVAMAIAGKALFGLDMLDEADDLGAALSTALHWTAETAMSVALGMQFQLAWLMERTEPRLPEALRGWTSRAVTRLHDPILWPTPRDRTLAKAVAVIDRRVDRMIQERRSAPGRQDDLLARLLEARGEDGKPAMSDRQLRDEIVTLFIAGHETTATALAWSLYLLGRAPAERARLESEIGGLEDLPASAADLARLPYTQQVFKESLRLYPPVPVYERVALEPMTVGGYRLDKGAFCTVFPWALHHRPEVYSDPDRFDPDRFREDREAKLHRYAFVPFGAGPRVCIGNHFALLEGPLVLATMLKRLSFEAIDPAPIGLDPTSATLRPIRPIRMRVQRKTTARPSATVESAPR